MKIKQIYSYAAGIEALKNASKNFPDGSGVYKFLDSDSQILYVGKAKNLKKRITSYLNNKYQTNRMLSSNPKFGGQISKNQKDILPSIPLWSLGLSPLMSLLLRTNFFIDPDARGTSVIFVLRAHALELLSPDFLGVVIVFVLEAEVVELLFLSLDTPLELETTAV